MNREKVVKTEASDIDYQADIIEEAAFCELMKEEKSTLVCYILSYMDEEQMKYVAYEMNKDYPDWDDIELEE